MSDLYDKTLAVRLAPIAEALEILSEPQIVARVGSAPISLRHQPWIIDYAGARMLFIFWPLGSVPNVYHVHIACPLQSIRACRILAKGVDEWLFSIGAEVLVTSCPEGKIANMARKLGWTEIGVKCSLVHFIKLRDRG